MNESYPRHFEELEPDLTPEEACLATLLDLKEYQTIEPGKGVGAFYTAYTGRPAPESLTTSIGVYSNEQHSQGTSGASRNTSYIEGHEITATLVVQLRTRTDEGRRFDQLNLDFVKEPEGLQLLQRELVRQGEGRVMRYTRRIDDEELAALAKDAMAIKDMIIEEDAELMKLGPLVEGEAEDGSRRFHISDILSVITGRSVSLRGMDGTYDILGFMTNDRPSNTQLRRFFDECTPHILSQLGEAIGQFAEVPNTVTDKLSLYKWLRRVTDAMGGDPFLVIQKMSEKDHAVIDPRTELELDHGPDIMKRFISTDPDANEPDDK